MPTFTEREKEIYEMGEMHGQFKYRDWLLAKVEEHFHDTMPPYIWPTILPGDTTTVNEALMGVWDQARIQILELIKTARTGKTRGLPTGASGEHSQQVWRLTGSGRSNEESLWGWVCTCGMYEEGMTLHGADSAAASHAQAAR